MRILHLDDSTRLAVRVAGSGPVAVVLTHGFAQSSGCWHHQVSALVAAGHRVITWDLRGHGTSSTAHDDFTIDRLADDLAEVIGAFAPTGPLVLVGHSMGGMTMMALGERHPELVRSRVAAVGFLATAVDQAPLAWLGMREAAAPLIRRVAAFTFATLAPRKQAWRLVRASGVVGEWAMWALCCAWPTTRADTRLTIELARGGGFASMHHYLPALLGHDRAAGLAAYRGKRALVLNGTADLLVRPDASDVIAAALPGARRVVVPRAGHNIMLAAHARVTDELVRLADLPDWTSD